MKSFCILILTLTVWCVTETYTKSFPSNMNGTGIRRSAGCVGTNYLKCFYLWTGDSKVPENLDPHDPMILKHSTFKARKTFIIIHGYMGWGMEDWILELKDKLLQRSDCNVISMDWYADATFHDYLTVYRRVIHVAAQFKDFVLKLRLEKGLSEKEIHVFGHSLGAHIAGLSAKVLPDKYGRITGLDPAGYMYRGVKAKDRLDRSDADFVDIIHTNGCYNPWNILLSCFGINENIGHVDFWPNGGETQPACSNGHEGPMCHQMMSYKYFIKSFDFGVDETYFLARNCSDWRTFKAGNCGCNHDAQYMGFNVNRRMLGRFYLATSSISPYAMKDDSCPSSGDIHNRRILTGCLLVLGALILVVSLIGGGVLLKRKLLAPLYTLLILPSTSPLILPSSLSSSSLENEPDEDLITMAGDHEQNEQVKNLPRQMIAERANEKECEKDLPIQPKVMEEHEHICCDDNYVNIE